MQEYLTYDDFKEIATARGWKIGVRGAPFMASGFPVAVLKLEVPWPPVLIDLMVPCNYAENHSDSLGCCFNIIGQALANHGVVSRA